MILETLTVAAGCFYMGNKINTRATIISEKGKSLIKSMEGLRLNAYRDSVGVLTIGFGHTGADVYEGQTITMQQADTLFENDTKLFAEKVLAAIGGTKLNQNQFDAVVSFAYNVGINNFKSSTLYKKIMANPGDIAIAAEFKKWVNAGGNVIAGLVTRRNKESNLYFA